MPGTERAKRDANTGAVEQRFADIEQEQAELRERIRRLERELGITDSGNDSVPARGESPHA